MRNFLTLFLVILGSLGLACPAVSMDKQVVGWIEGVRIYPGNLLVRAKLDTGAKNSSLNAPRIVQFERHGEEWVRFDVTDRQGKRATLERKVHRVAKIKQRGAKAEERLVVRLGICLGGVYREAEVNLTDRTGFNYQMIIGRSYLKEGFLIDSSATFTTESNCKAGF